MGGEGGSGGGEVQNIYLHNGKINEKKLLHAK